MHSVQWRITKAEIKKTWILFLEAKSHNEM